MYKILNVLLIFPPKGQNLFYDAVHQIGHILGLGHTDVKDAIMWPYAKGFVPGLELSETDIRNVQAIHGKATIMFHSLSWSG